MNVKRLGAIAVLISLSGVSFADSCVHFMQSKGGANTLVMTSLNRNGVASFAMLSMNHVDAIRKPPIIFPEKYVTVPDAQPQYFSDRMIGGQRFANNHADQISVTMTVADEPQVTLTLNTWNNAKNTFNVTCTADGVMHASTPDVDYLFHFSFDLPIQ